MCRAVRTGAPFTPPGRAAADGSWSMSLPAPSIYAKPAMQPAAFVATFRRPNCAQIPQQGHFRARCLSLSLEFPRRVQWKPVTAASCFW
jgi:hypothetical protein